MPVSEPGPSGILARIISFETVARLHTSLDAAYGSPAIERRSAEPIEILIKLFVIAGEWPRVGRMVDKQWLMDAGLEDLEDFQDHFPDDSEWSIVEVNTSVATEEIICQIRIMEIQ